MQDDGELWHLVEARRDDGSPALFRIRELDPRPEQPTIFVVEMPFHSTEMSALPNAAQYRRLDGFRGEWLLPASDALIARFAPFDPDLGFYDDADPTWAEYGYLRELLEEAKQLPLAPKPTGKPAKPRPTPKARDAKPKARAKRAAKPAAKPKARPKPTPKPKAKAKKKK